MKFGKLLRKEVKELLTIQAIIGVISSLFAFYLLGTFMGDVMKDLEKDATTITICDQDNSPFTQSIITALESQKDLTLKKYTLESDDYQKELKRLDLKNLIIIPKGFTDTVLSNSKQATLKSLTVMDSISMTNSASGEANSSVVDMLEKAIKTSLMTTKNMSADEIKLLDDPIKLDEITIVGEKTAEVNPSVLSTFVSMQSIFVPIVIFVLVIYASQLIISAIATEKVDKTLETLLSTPVSRLAVLASKMLAAALVAAINAAAYLFGFSKFMSGITGPMTDASGNVNDFISQLGLKLNTGGYLMLGLQMFLTILIALSISLILGALAKDVKSAQTLTMPIMICAMIPYMLTMFIDVSKLSIVPRLLIYAIPFTHTFTAVDNILFAKNGLFWGGVIYQVIFLCVCMFFAVRVFMTDKLFTISLSFGQKAKARKNKSVFGGLLKK